MKGVTNIISSRKVDPSPARVGRLLNSPVDGVSIQTFSVPSSPKVPHIAEKSAGRRLSGVLTGRSGDLRNQGHSPCSSQSFQKPAPPTVSTSHKNSLVRKSHEKWVPHFSL